MSLFAIVPAAGLSRRMGQPKLVMDVGGKSVIERLLTALSHRAVTATVVVLRKNDDQLAKVISELAMPNVVMVQPEIDPPDMKASVGHAIRLVQSRYSPKANDGWMLIPADHTVLDPGVLAELIAAWETTTEEILTPQFGGKSGHPTFFRWSLSERICEIPDDQGLNWLRSAQGVRVLKKQVSSQSILLDLDTPEDYEQIVRYLTMADQATADA